MCDVSSRVLDRPSDCADPFSSSLQYLLLSVYTQSTLAAPSELLKAGLGFYAMLLNSESRLFTVMLPCISGRPVGSMGFGVREGSKCGHGRQEGGVRGRGGQSWPSKGIRGRDTNGRQNGGLIFQAREAMERTEESS